MKALISIELLIEIEEGKEELPQIFIEKKVPLLLSKVEGILGWGWGINPPTIIY